MRIAILGGTGDIGEGLALRLARDTTHEIRVGSRDAKRGRQAAGEYAERLAERGYTRELRGFENADAAEGADVIVLSIPPYYVTDTVDSIEGAIGEAILVTPAVGFDRDQDGFHYDPPQVGSVTALVNRAAPAESTVVGTFHVLPAARISDLDDELGLDTPVVADDADAKETVLGLIEAIEGLYGVDAGPIANAPEIEGLVPLLLNVAENSKREDIGIRFT